MNANRIETGKVYEITIGRNMTTVKVVSVERRVNGQLVFDCLNVKTAKRMTVSDAKRFRREIKTAKAAKTEQAKGGKPKGMLSGLDAAHKVLTEAGCPMNVREILETATQNGYCQLGGATPALTIYAAMQREIAAKGANSRFTKIERGLFAAR